MVVPGGIIVEVLWNISSICELFDNVKNLPTWGQMFVFTVASYLFGIMNNAVTELIWVNFRNNRNAIAVAFRSDEGSIIKGITQILSTILAVYIGIGLSITVWMMSYKILSITILTFIIGLKYYDYKTYNRSYNKILVKYYRAYYYVEKARPSNSAKIIEAQVAFLKTICLPICIVSVCLFCDGEYQNYWLLGYTTALVISIIMVINCRQNTIYRVIIEDYKFLSTTK